MLFRSVVEWGSGLVERLSDSRLEVRIERSGTTPAAVQVADDGDDAEPLDPRVVRVQGYGPRWTFLARLPR